MLNLLLAAALLVPQSAPLAGAPQREPASEVLKKLFPAPSGPMTLEAGSSDNPLTYKTLVDQYRELTGQFFVVSEDTKDMLTRPLFLDRSMTVPVNEVQTVFEELLRHGEFVLEPLTTSGPRIIRLTSLLTNERNILRSRTTFLGPDELHLAERHPALLVTTVVNLPNVDVRQMSNSMRTMITDANTQQMLPAGNSNSMILVGFGDQVAALSDALHMMNEAADASAKDARSVLEVIRLENANAQAIAVLLSEAYAKPEGQPGDAQARFSADERTNSILITTRAGQLAAIKSLVAKLDTK